ncbi:MAG: hypothetical protein Q9195_000504 [Heterodermia aff. obscurata]
MGRYDMRPLRVHHTAIQLRTAGRISTLPPWHSVVDSIPPAQALVRSQPLQHTPQTRPRKAKARKASKLFRPTNITYREDRLRRDFFGDHPWELARPRVVLENDGKDYEKNDWSMIFQPGRPVTGESVIQRQLWLLDNVPNMTKASAYDQARKEFYKFRLHEDVRRRVAKEEALATGAYFHKSTLEVGMEIEDRQYEEWKEWAITRVKELEQKQNAMYTGQDNESMDLLDDDPETEAALEEISDDLPAQGQSALGGARAIPASQGVDAMENFTTGR